MAEQLPVLQLTSLLAPRMCQQLEVLLDGKSQIKFHVIFTFLPKFSTEVKPKHILIANIKP